MKVVYLHGMGGSPGDWKEITALVPGECLALPPSGSFEEVTRFLALSLRERRDPFLLCGYSLGGRLAAAAASLLPGSALRGLVLLSSGMGFTSEETRTERRAADHRWANLAHTDPENFWREWYAQGLFSSFQELPEAQRSAWMKERFTIDINKLNHQLVDLSPASHESLLPGVLALESSGISVLYIAGERDKKYANLAMQLKEKGVMATILPAGHILPLEAPEEVSACLKRFLAELEGT